MEAEARGKKRVAFTLFFYSRLHRSHSQKPEVATPSSILLNKQEAVSQFNKTLRYPRRAWNRAIEVHGWGEFWEPNKRLGGPLWSPRL